MSKKNRIRLFASAPLMTGGEYVLSENQAHYVLHVMRLKKGDEIFLFDGQNGEFKAQIDRIEKKNVVASIKEKVFDFVQTPDVWLLFAPLKKESMDDLISKAVELGAAKLMPVITEFSITSEVKEERLKMQITEASEQSRRQDVPTLEKPVKFADVYNLIEPERTLVYLDETGKGEIFINALQKIKNKTAFLVGPEGGFSQKELDRLQQQKNALGVSLGLRILRAETAAAAALACFQAFCGDWKEN